MTVGPDSIPCRSSDQESQPQQHRHDSSAQPKERLIALDVQGFVAISEWVVRSIDPAKRAKPSVEAHGINPTVNAAPVKDPRHRAPLGPAVRTDLCYSRVTTSPTPLDDAHLGDFLFPKYRRRRCLSRAADLATPARVES